MGEGFRVKTESNRLKVLVFGAGAIGCLYAAILSRLGCQVSIIGRKRIVSQAKCEGIRVKGEVSFKAEVWDAAENPSDLKKQKNFDIIFLTVKAYDVAEASRQIAKTIKPNNTCVICLQNGLEVEREASENLKEGFQVFRGVSFCGAYMEAETVNCTGIGETVIGCRSHVESLVRAVGMLSEAGFPARFENSVEEVVWEKTLVNAGINPLGALTGLKNGELLEVEGLKEVIAETVREGLNVAHRIGVRLRKDPVAETFKTIRDTAENYNSMLQDIRRRKKTEIDYINGAIVKLGERTRVPTPLNKLLTLLVKGLEEGLRRNVEF
jgi:2-dehydropantoate 2-reductase